MAGTIDPTATKVKSEGSLVNRLGDVSSTLKIIGTDSVSGATCQFNVVAEITDAGQTKVKAQ